MINLYESVEVSQRHERESTTRNHQWDQKKHQSLGDVWEFKNSLLSGEGRGEGRGMKGARGAGCGSAVKKNSPSTFKSGSLQQGLFVNVSGNSGANESSLPWRRFPFKREENKDNIGYWACRPLRPVYPSGLEYNIMAKG